MWHELLFFATVAAAGMFVHGFAGFAAGLLCIPLMGLRLEAELYVPAFGICVFLVNLGLLGKARGHVDWRHVGGLLLGAVPLVPIGVLLLKVAPTGVIVAVVSLMALFLGIMYLSGVNVPIGRGWPSRLGLGGLSGFLVGMTGAGGPPVVVYAIAQGWAKERFRGTLMAYFMCIGIATLVFWALNGVFTKAAFTYSAVALVPMILAGAAGTWLKTKTDEKRFRAIILWLLIAVGVVGLAKGMISMIGV